MSRKYYLNIIKVSFFLIITFFFSCGNKSSTSPGGDEDTTGGSKTSLSKEIYDVVIQSQINYIKGLQLPSGAIKDNTASNSKITPYFANYAMIALLKNPTEENVNVAKKYIKWYLSRLNGSVNPVSGDMEIPGSVYDYYAPDETTKGTYDSIDSYAATFLMLLRQMALVSDENENWLRQFATGIDSVATALEATMDTENTKIPTGFSNDDNDYLSIATYNYPAKYLMDNCEVNLGLKSAKWLQDKGLLTTSSNYDLMINKNTTSINSALWRDVMYNYIKQRGDEGKLTSSWTKFYPDAVAQLFPAIFDVISPSSKRAKDLYAKFNLYYSHWSSGDLDASYPWTLLPYAAAKMKDTARVEAYIKYIYLANSENKQRNNWYSAEAAHLLSAIDAIKE